MLKNLARVISEFVAVGFQTSGNEFAIHAETVQNTASQRPQAYAVSCVDVTRRPLDYYRLAPLLP